MNIYEQSKTGKRRNSCSYCRQEGHNRSECTQVARDWRYWELYQIPPYYVTYFKAQTNPAGWAKWYEECRDAYAAQQAKKAKASTPVRRSVPKCGFCGATDHNRRNCNKMKSFLADCYKANENWRRAAHRLLSRELGLGVGAAVKIKNTRACYTGEEEECIGLITSVNWDKLNIMTAYDSTWEQREKYAQRLEVRVMVEGRSDSVLGLDTFIRKIKPAYGMVVSVNNAGAYYGTSLAYCETVGKAEKPLSEDWITSYKEAFDFLVKKRSYESLEQAGIVDLIDKWK